MELSTAQVCAAIKRPPRSIQYWIAYGLVIPDRQLAGHSGAAHLFSELNLVEFAVTTALRDLGVSLLDIKRLLDYGRTEHLRARWFALDRGFQQWVVITDRSGIGVVTASDGLALRPDALSYLALNLSVLKSQIANFLGKRSASDCATTQGESHDAYWR